MNYLHFNLIQEFPGYVSVCDEMDEDRIESYFQSLVEENRNVIHLYREAFEFLFPWSAAQFNISKSGIEQNIVQEYAEYILIKLHNIFLERQMSQQWPGYTEAEFLAIYDHLSEFNVCDFDLDIVEMRTEMKFLNNQKEKKEILEQAFIAAGLYGYATALEVIHKLETLIILKDY